MSRYRFLNKKVSFASFASFASFHYQTGLPDGLFSNQKSQFGKILEGHRWVNVDIFYGHREYFTDIWDILHMTN
jgi:hypothetical protein